MNTSKKYLVIINIHKSEGIDKNSFKLVLRGRNEESLRKGLSNFIRKEIESLSVDKLKNEINSLSSEMIEKEIKTVTDNWELYPSSEKIYKKDYLYEPEPGEPNPCVEYTCRIYSGKKYYQISSVEIRI